MEDIPGEGFVHLRNSVIDLCKNVLKVNRNHTIILIKIINES